MSLFVIFFIFILLLKNLSLTFHFHLYLQLSNLIYVLHIIADWDVDFLFFSALKWITCWYFDHNLASTLFSCFLCWRFHSEDVDCLLHILQSPLLFLADCPGLHISELDISYFSQQQHCPFYKKVMLYFFVLPFHGLQKGKLNLKCLWKIFQFR